MTCGPYLEDDMAEWTLNLMDSLGYVGIVLLMILEHLP